MIVIVEYGVGNTGSVHNALKHLKADVTVSGDPKLIQQASGIILPGVGSFDYAMQGLAGIRDVLEAKVLGSKTPLLGICLGMQLLAERSEEGKLPGLGWVKGTVERLPAPASKQAARVPHMGWNAVAPTRVDSLFQGTEEEWNFYFVHSYFVRPAKPEHTLGTTVNGVSFTSTVQADNIFGVQFHPEKSHHYGLRLLSNFVRMTK